MIYLVMAILSSALISICMRYSENHVKNEMGMFMANYAVCILLAILHMEGGADGSILAGMGLSTVLMGAVCGILYLANFVFLKYNMKNNGVVMSTTFMKLGVLIPTLMAILVFREIPTGLQVLGIGLAIIAIIMIHFEKDAMGESHRKLGLLGLLLLSGTTDSMANIFEKLGANNAKDGYLLMTFLTAFLIALILMFRGKEKVSKKDVFFGILIGIPNYFSARFLLLALGEVSAVLAYPMYSVGTIILITVVGMLLFRERISRKKTVALIMILVSLGLLNG